MIMGSVIPPSGAEASRLCCDVQASLNNDVKNLAVSGQETSVADKDEKTIQVLGEALSPIDYYRKEAHSKLDQEATSPKPTVYTLHPGQYLPCGIGVRPYGHAQYDLGSSDVRRWELAASAIVDIMKSSPRERYNLADTVKIESLNRFLAEHEITCTFEEYLPNLINDVLETLDRYLGPRVSVLKETWALFLYLLRFFIPLTAAYGGIHLTAWNFEFPSRIESIIWRIACFIIIGSSFALLAPPSWNNIPWPYVYGSGRAYKFATSSHEIVGNVFFWLLLLCYAAARLYLVVESFISLRHVPIGVYAAVPWVQNIPHV